MDQRFAAHEHHVLATIGVDGGPCMWGINVAFDAGQMWFGSMVESVKMNHLRSRPQCSLHSAPLDSQLIEPDIAIRAHATVLSPQESGKWLDTYAYGVSAKGDVAHLMLSEVRAVQVHQGELVTTIWTPTKGIREVRRN